MRENSFSDSRREEGAELASVTDRVTQKQEKKAAPQKENPERSETISNDIEKHSLAGPLGASPDHAMKIILPLLLFAAAITSALAQADRASSTVILDEAGVRNLGIETVEALEADFEDTLFALGRIEVIPARKAILSTRIPGRIIDIKAFEGDTVTQGQVLAVVESRQPGNPPPRVDLPAPLGGLILQAHANLGDPVSPDSHILEIVDLSEAYAIARIPEDQAGRLQPGKTEARIRIPSLPGKEFSGTMIRFGTSADRESGTLDALFHLKDLAGDVRPDMRAEFSIVTERRENVMAVPREAIQGDGANRFVFVKDFDLANAFVRAPVRIGARNDRYVEIKSGLFPGDDVVTVGAYPLVFAGGGGISLKEALDAAHGHEHNEDGTEMTSAQRAADAAEKAAASGSTKNTTPLTLFLAILSTLLALLLTLSLLRRPKQIATTDNPTQS